jgi:hypothetical protein
MNMLAAAANTEHPLAYMGVADAAVVALLGYAVVFFGLILLMVVVMIMGKAFSASAKTDIASAVGFYRSLNTFFSFSCISRAKNSNIG